MREASEMTKRDIIDRIRRHNPSADTEFLATFSEEELLAYLHHLGEVESDRRRRKDRELEAATR
jgi:hypothetical protein